MNEAEQLLRVQDLDTRADQLRHRRSHLPEAAAADDLRRRRTAEQAAHDHLVARHAVVTAAQNEAEATTAANERTKASLDRKLSTTSVPREAETLMTELRHLAERQVAIDDALLGSMVELESLDADIAPRAATLAQLGEELSVAEAAQATAAAAVDAELAAVSSERAIAVDGLPAALMARYERLRGRNGGIGIARIVERHCSGCQLELSSGGLQELRHLPPGEIAECEQCGRMLVP